MAYPASGWACDNPNGKGRYEPFHYQVACSIISPHPRLGAAQNPFEMDRTIHRYSPALPAKLISQVLGFWIVRSIQLFHVDRTGFPSMARPPKPPPAIRR